MKVQLLTNTRNSATTVLFFLGVVARATINFEATPYFRVVNHALL